ncbi:MAG: 50S ribosomal protein L22 [Candidatus Micrarchaeota archaeon]|nr:50S ribosomal protein L22 [Candidatus Micrarchaeota archaeon]
MGYSFNIGGEFAKAQKSGINASYKQLSIVCNAIRYTRVSKAISTMDGIINMQMPILFSKYNKHMGARHELHGRKGAYPVKAAKEIKVVLQNAVANAEGKGMSGADELFIVHAAANKVQTIRRQPSKGSISWGRGMYGRSAMMHSDIELSKVEIILGTGTEETLSKNMKYFIKKKDVKSKNQSKQGTAVKGSNKMGKPALPKTVDITKPADVKKLQEGLKTELAKKAAEKKEAAHEHSHEGHDHSHEHEHSHEGHTHAPNVPHPHETKSEHPHKEHKEEKKE